MRLILIGTRQQRQRLRERLASGPPEIVAEFESLAAARASALFADAFVSTAPRAPSDEEDSDSPPIEPLTPREIDVLELVAEGLPNKLIAERLGISDQTVKFHVAAIAGKLGAANRTDAVRRAVRNGLITL
jgi:DNA-binding NarL/FixJ family response regulator